MHESIKPPTKRVRSPWVWAAAGLLAAVLLGASALHFVTASCAAVGGPPPDTVPSASRVTTGQAYFYYPGNGDSSCSFGPLATGGLYVSVGPAQYAGGAACGSYLDVTGPDGTVRAEVVDLCRGCSGGGLDMSEAAFGRVASTAAGTARVSYRVAADPRLPGPLELRLARSASAGWLAVQVLNNGNPLRSVRVARAGHTHWRPLVLNSDDYWAAPAGAGPGPFRFLVTDAFGHRAVLDGIRLLPGSVQRTRVPMYTTAAAGHPRPATHAASAAHGPLPKARAHQSRSAAVPHC